MSIQRTLSSLGVTGAILVMLLLGQAQGQQTPQDYDENYAYGNAPYSNAYPQNKPSILPFNPIGLQAKWQLFAPANISDYGGGPKPKKGWFFSYERVYWSISKPPTATIGNPSANGFYQEISANSVYEASTLDTSMLTAKAGWGNRWETGFIDSNNHGWMVSVIDHVFQTQDFQYMNPVMLFADPQHVLNGFLQSGFGIDADLNHNGINGRDGVVVPSAIPGVFTLAPAPTDVGDEVTFIPRFSTMHVYNRIVLNGTELNRIYRAPQFHNGGVVDFIYGARWFQADDTFQVVASGGVLDQTNIHNRVQNNLIGPQMGLRYNHQRGHWMVNLEARFTAAANFQNFHQTSQIASNFNNEQNVLNSATSTTSYSFQTAANSPFLIYTPTYANEIRNAPANLNAYGSTASASPVKFAPLGEFRANATYEITRAFGVTVGYTVLYVNGISRASDTINYALPTMGLQNLGARDNLIIQGLNFGFTFNR
jgi:hypothetical protein